MKVVAKDADPVVGDASVLLNWRIMGISSPGREKFWTRNESHRRGGEPWGKHTGSNIGSAPDRRTFESVGILPLPGQWVASVKLKRARKARGTLRSSFAGFKRQPHDMYTVLRDRREQCRLNTAAEAAWCGLRRLIDINHDEPINWVVSARPNISIIIRFRFTISAEGLPQDSYVSPGLKYSPQCPPQSSVAHHLSDPFASPLAIGSLDTARSLEYTTNNSPANAVDAVPQTSVVDNSHNSEDEDLNPHTHNKVRIVDGSEALEAFNESQTRLHACLQQMKEKEQEFESQHHDAQKTNLDLTVHLGESAVRLEQMLQYQHDLELELSVAHDDGLATQHLREMTAQIITQVLTTELEKFRTELQSRAEKETARLYTCFQQMEGGLKLVTAEPSPHRLNCVKLDSLKSVVGDLKLATQGEREKPLQGTAHMSEWAVKLDSLEFELRNLGMNRNINGHSPTQWLI
ncbi:hypothetical protein B0H16DRAFT_1469536 [Mycena metata]|uniref:Uncharacterized protein n=1 Tax=Mycena metata TaxID=1033252 RepID=A0AAD7HXM8_9AGAR|nr:hypothetical protein B0H16DRAFT_1469536 [Mycena metata]